MITTEEAKSYIADNLNAALVALGMSQGDLARSIQFEGEVLQNARMRVSNYCCGKALPNAAVLVNLAEVLGCTADELLAKPKPKKSP